MELEDKKTLLLLYKRLKKRLITKPDADSIIETKKLRDLLLDLNILQVKSSLDVDIKELEEINKQKEEYLTAVHQRELDILALRKKYFERTIENAREHISLGHMGCYCDKWENGIDELVEEEKAELYDEHHKIEQELGIDLITLIKAFENGFYYKGDELDNIAYCSRDFITYCVRKKCFTPNGEMIFIKDYGKTWALTKEELEK